MKTIVGILMASLTICVWGVTFVNTKSLLGDFSALEIQVLRFALAYVALWACHPHLGRATRKDEFSFFLMGMFGVAVYQLLENCAIHFTNASNVSILVSLCPIVTAVLMRYFGRGGPLRPTFFAGCAVAMLGVSLVSFDGIRTFHFRPTGDLLAVAAMLSWGVYSLLVTKISQRGYPQAFVVRRMFFWSLVLTLPLVAFGTTEVGRGALGGSLAVALQQQTNALRFGRPTNLVNLAFLGLLASAACFVMWNKAIQALGVVRCTVGLYLIPAITVLFAYCFLGEALTFASAAGALLITAGVVMSGWNGLGKGA